MIFKITPLIIWQLAVAGVALSLLFFGCEREVDLQRHDKCEQQEALELFLMDYVPNQDDFKDRVVNGMLTKNGVDSAIYKLTQCYGQPLWSIERTAVEKSLSALFVPLTDPATDSITAVILFTQQAGADSITYRVLNSQHPDTLVTDFLQYCQTTIYGKGFNSSRLIKPQKNSKDYNITITGCWDVFTGNSTLLTYSYSFCTWKITYLPTLSIDDGGGGSSGAFPDPGGGSSGGGNSGGNGGTGIGSGTGTSDTQTDCSRGMTIQELDDIKTTRETIKNRSHCASNKILGATEKILYEIDPCMASGTFAEYTLNSSRIQFRNAGEINEARLYEETMHAYQDLFYNGLSKYGPGKAGYTNMEFEAKVMYAIYWYQKGLGELPVLFYGMDDVQQGMFMDWFDEIISNGATDSVLSNYNELIKLFNAKNPAYANCISLSFPRLSVIINLLNGCPKS